jgi:hypothetical protein
MGGARLGARREDETLAPVAVHASRRLAEKLVAFGVALLQREAGDAGGERLELVVGG